MWLHLGTLLEHLFFERGLVPTRWKHKKKNRRDEMKPFRFNVRFLVLAAVLGLTAPALAAGSFTNIDVPGATTTEAWGINNSGVIVGDYVDGGGIFHGFVKSGDSFTPVDFPGACGTSAKGINNSGAIVGNWCDSSPQHAQHGYL